MTHVLKKWDEAVRPVRTSGKGARAYLELPEERVSTKGNPDGQSTPRTRFRGSVAVLHRPGLCAKKRAAFSRAEFVFETDVF